MQTAEWGLGPLRADPGVASGDPLSGYKGRWKLRNAKAAGPGLGSRGSRCIYLL